jgi:beta-glucosidase
MWHGYTKFGRDGLTPRFAFGHGQSFTTFDYRALKAHARKGVIHVQVGVGTCGSIPADEVVLAFTAPPGLAAERPKNPTRNS